jgi:signal transduction histidine kinase
MTPTNPAAKDHNSKPWSPFNRIWNTISYLMLGICLAISLVDTSLQLSQKGLVVLLAAAWGGWYWVFIMQRTRLQINRLGMMLSFLGAVAISTALSWTHSAFTMLLFSFYGITFAMLPMGWAAPLVIAVSIILALRFVDFSVELNLTSLSILVSFLLSGFFAILLGLFINSIIRQTSEKQKMIEELNAARDDLAQAERQAGVLEERQRLASEIHDTLAQGFTSVVMHLEAAEQALEHDPASARLHIDQARSTARDSLGEARRFVWALRPDMVQRETLDLALQRVARRWSEESSLPARVEISGISRPLTPPIEATLLRAAQEGLGNVHKHARAAQVILTLTYMDDEIILDVQDDGAGFDPEVAPQQARLEHRGYGLLSLQERASQLGGSLTVESAPGEGTTLVLSLPISGKSDRGEQNPGDER